MIQALQRGLEILDVLAAAEAPMRCTALATHLGVDTSTAHRLLQTLAAHGYVAKDETSKMYTLGIAGLALARAFLRRLDVRAAARETLECLAGQTGECLHLAIEQDDQAVFVESLSGSHILTANTEVGQTEPLYCTAVGKALLAALAEGRVRELLPGRRRRFTSNTHATVRAVLDDLTACRKRGWSEDDEEYQEGIRCVASWIVDFEGTVIASIGLSAPKSRMSRERMAELGRLVKDAAVEISDRLGAPARGDVSSED